MKWKTIIVTAIVGAIAGIVLEEPVKRLVAAVKAKLES